MCRFAQLGESIRLGMLRASLPWLLPFLPLLPLAVLDSAAFALPSHPSHTSLGLSRREPQREQQQQQ